MRRERQTFFPQLNPVSQIHSIPDSREITGSNFDRLLDWLNPDREKAGLKYEEIRRKLIKIFTCRCCDCPEDLADETINRVIKKVHEVAPGFEGDPALFFCGVARNVVREVQKRRAPSPPPPAPAPSIEYQRELECLDQCMDTLTSNSRELIIEFHSEDKRAKIEKREKKMANELGIAPNALRIRAHRIRSKLEACVSLCLDKSSHSRAETRLITNNPLSEEPKGVSQMQTAVGYRILIRRYLLGDLTEAERELLEDKIMCESGLFRELLIVEDELIDEYVCEKLSVKERKFFEACFLHHNEKRHQKLRFAWALKTYVSRDPNPNLARPQVKRQGKQDQRRFFSALFRSPQVALGSAMAVTFMAVVLGVTYSVVTVTGLQSDVARIQADQRENGESVTAALLTPGGMRSSGQTAKINILPETLLMEFQLDMAADDYESYRAVLTNEGKEVLRQELLRAQDLGDRIIISLELPAGVLPYGDYQIRLEGKVGGDEYEYVDTYNFRAIVN